MDASRDGVDVGGFGVGPHAAPSAAPAEPAVPALGEAGSSAAASADPLAVQIALQQDIARSMRELTGLTRELLAAAREQSAAAREVLELSRRAEQRFLEQQQAQREEFGRFLREHEVLRGRCTPAEQTVGGVLGKALTELVDYVEEHGEDLNDSEFLRSEMSDRYGAMLHHVWVIHGILRRLSSADQQVQQQQQQGPPRPPL